MVMVRVTIAQFPARKDGKVDLGEDEDCNK